MILVFVVLTAVIGLAKLGWSNIDKGEKLSVIKVIGNISVFMIVAAAILFTLVILF